jgi:hypothetical protein
LAECKVTQKRFRNSLGAASIIPIDLRKTWHQPVVGALGKSGDLAVALSKTHGGFLGYFYDFQSGRFMEASVQEPDDLSGFSNARCIELCDVNVEPLKNLLQWMNNLRGAMPTEYFSASPKVKAALRQMPGQFYSVFSEIYRQDTNGGPWVGMSLTELRGCQNKQDIIWVGISGKSVALDTQANTLTVEDRLNFGGPLTNTLTLAHNKHEFIAEVKQMNDLANEMRKYHQSLGSLYSSVYSGDLEAASKVSGRLADYRKRHGL